MGVEVSSPEEEPVSKKEPEGPDQPKRLNTVWGITKNLFRRLYRHDCTEMAGEMAFDFGFAIFPTALFTATMVVQLGLSKEVIFQSLDVLGIFLHDVFREMIEDTITSLFDSSEQLLTVGGLGALWAGSSAISATIKALNRAYGVQETRSLIHRRLLSLGLLFGVGVALVVAFNMLIIGGWIEQHIIARFGLEKYLPPAVTNLKWPIGFLSGMMMAGILYRLAPNYKLSVIRVLPGAVLFTVFWFGLSKAFGYYVGAFSYYSMVTGFLWIFIVLQLWIYLSALLFLLGGELNGEIEERLNASA
ncbi:MAG: YihY/virulence factor BrkB family protein [bacterium]|nr:YihY/virulence factor BrkB family protein [bacterium]